MDFGGAGAAQQGLTDSCQSGGGIGCTQKGESWDFDGPLPRLMRFNYTCSLHKASLRLCQTLHLALQLLLLLPGLWLHTSMPPMSAALTLPFSRCR